MYTEEYLKSILAPFDGKTVRMRSTQTNGLIIEPSMESNFSFEVDWIGISLFLSGSNFYAEQELTRAFRAGMKDADIPIYKLEKLNSDTEKDGDAYRKIVDGLSGNFKIQMGRIYLASIKTVEVRENGFTINGIEFFISK